MGEGSNLLRVVGGRVSSEISCSFREPARANGSPLL